MTKTGTILDYLSHSDFAPENEALDTDAGTVRGEPAKNKDAVQWVGPWAYANDGFAEHTRRCALALHQAGELVQLTNNALAYSVEPEIEDQVRHILDIDTSSFRLRVLQMVPSEQSVGGIVSHPFYPAEVMAGRNKRTAIYVVCEYEGISGELARLLNRAGKVWTTTERTKNMLASAGVQESKLRIVPVPFAANDPLISIQGKPRKAGPPRFLNIGKWEPRKAQHELIGSFLMAFEPGKAEMLIKTSQYSPKYKGYPADVAESARLWLDDARVKSNGWDAETIRTCLKTMQANVPASHIRGMHLWSDVYCSLSHGEGWDMPAFDAKVAGRRLVYTASGGPEEFANDDDIAVPFAGLEDCHPWYAWGNAKWTASKAEDAVDALRRAAKLVEDGVPGTPVRSEFSAADVGTHIRSLLAQMESEP